MPNNVGLEPPAIVIAYEAILDRLNIERRKLTAVQALVMLYMLRFGNRATPELLALCCHSSLRTTRKAIRVVSPIVGALGDPEEALAVDEFIRRLPPAPPPPRKKAVIPQALRWAVFERDDFRCRNCGARSPLAADHVIPESKGGPTEIGNLQTLCRTCNSRKAAR